LVIGDLVIGYCLDNLYLGYWLFSQIGKRHFHKRRPTFFKRYRINEWIKAPQVKLIDPDEGFVGIVDTAEALRKAKEKNLDLIEVGPTDNPPVAKILDYGKFKYEQEKKQQKMTGRTKRVEIKGIRLTLKMAEHDLETKKKQSQKFLKDGHKIRLEMLLRGREAIHTKRASDLMREFIAQMQNEASIIEPLNKKGIRITAVLQSKS
jgi:translation initiation factor IF-3